MDYKETLHMPKTDFEMRGNLTKKEPGILKQWQENNYYQDLLKHHEGQKHSFYMMVLHMRMVTFTQELQ